ISGPIQAALRFWDGLVCICLPLLVSADPQVLAEESLRGSSQLHLSHTYFHLFFFSCIYSSIYYDSLVCSCFVFFVCC
uniref:Uncharacterized protein n=1 Tax=Sparus aurata TaxID=8175 RepID=A0A671Y2F9_SPAAU